MKHADLNMTFRPSEMEGRVIRSNFEKFGDLVARADALLEKGWYHEAALHAEIAAVFAAYRHCGLFVSSELERILTTIGLTIPSDRLRPSTRGLGVETPSKILHVSTYVTGVGGLQSMLLRWIRHDVGKTHSVALTRQLRYAVPEALDAEVRSTGGRIYQVNRKSGGLLSWARELRQIASSADLVVLHIANDDIVPLIAFAEKSNSPPVVLLDHSDHLFWLGASISDLVIALRESGRRLAQQRRYIAPERSVLLPTLLEPTERTLSRAEAKRRLGMPENSVLLLCVARVAKFRSLHGTTYADDHVAILEKHRQALLVVVGSGPRDDWRSAIERTQGRIIPMPEKDDVSVLQQAADIYVDSFPFVSITSLMEAGSYGVPLVSRMPYSTASAIFGSDAPGLNGSLLRVNTLDQYAAALSRLIEDTNYRRALGDTTRAKILDMHMPPNWNRSLDKIYRRAMKNRASVFTLGEKDRMFDGEPDAFVPSIHGKNIDIGAETLMRMRGLPARKCLNQLRELTKRKQVNRDDLLAFAPFLMPEWVACQIFACFPAARGLFRRARPETSIRTSKA